MHIAHDIRWLDARFHLWEHNLMSSSEKMIHNRMFWAAAAVVIGVAALLALTIFMGSSEMESFSTPLVYPFNMYGH